MRRPTTPRQVKWLTVLVLLLAPGLACAEERYFMIVYGAQQGINVPKLSHTFATFVSQFLPLPTKAVE